MTAGWEKLVSKALKSLTCIISLLTLHDVGYRISTYLKATSGIAPLEGYFWLCNLPWYPYGITIYYMTSSRTMIFRDGARDHLACR